MRVRPKRRITLPDVPSPSAPFMCEPSSPFARAVPLVLTPMLAAGIFLDVPQSGVELLLQRFLLGTSFLQVTTT